MLCFNCLLNHVPITHGHYDAYELHLYRIYYIIGPCHVYLKQYVLLFYGSRKVSVIAFFHKASNYSMCQRTLKVGDVCYDLLVKTNIEFLRMS